MISVGKTASKKIWALIHSKKVLSPEVQLAATLEPLAYCQSVASLSLFYRYFFERCSSELAQLVPLPYFGGRSTHYSDIFHDFISPFLDVTRMSMSTVFFSCTARPWHSLLMECFPLTYDLNGFTSIINRHLLIVGSF